MIHPQPWACRVGGWRYPWLSSTCQSPKSFLEQTQNQTHKSLQLCSNKVWPTSYIYVCVRLMTLHCFDPGIKKFQTILTKSILSFLTNCCLEVQFLLVFSWTDLFIILTIRPLGPIILDSVFSSFSVLEFASPDSAPPLNKAHKSPRVPPSSQSVFVSLPASW